jgi:Na+/proline symporter
MTHQIKRGLIAGIVLWILIFVEVSILMFGFNLNRGDANYYFVHFILLAIFIILTSVWWFKAEKRRGFKEGIVVGVVMVVVTSILDGIITVPLFIKDYGFFSDWDILAGAVMMIIIPALVGLILPDQKSKPEKKKTKTTKKKPAKKAVKKTVKKPVKQVAKKPIKKTGKKK